MLKERQTAVANVAAAFRPAERAAQDAARGGASTIAVMIDEAQKNGFAPDLGLQALETLAEATLKAVQTYGLFATAHRQLKELPGQIGIQGYGGDDCPPDEPFYRRSAQTDLKVVA